MNEKTDIVIVIKFSTSFREFFSHEIDSIPMNLVHFLLQFNTFDFFLFIITRMNVHVSFFLQIEKKKLAGNIRWYKIRDKETFLESMNHHIFDCW